MSNRFLDIRPSNLPPNQSVSYKGGNPIITFDIPASQSELIGSSVRICGKIKITYDGTTPAKESNDGETLYMDSRLGMMSVFSQVSISSNSTKQNIETIRNYNRFMASYMPMTASNQDLIGHLDEAILCCPSTDAQQQGVVWESEYTNGNEFCLYTPTGLLNSGEAIPLDHIGGLTLDYYIAPDSQVLYDSNGNPTTSGLTNAQYELSDLKLICEIHDRSPEEQAQSEKSKSNGFEYKSISSYYSTLNSTNGILNYALGLSRVQSVFMNFIPSSYLNNLAQNSMQTIMPIKKTGAIANIKQVVATRGGVRMPYAWNLDTNYKEDANVKVVDPQIVRNFMTAFRPFSDMNRNQIEPSNTNRNWTSNDNDVVKGGLVYGLGISYSNIDGVDGANFSTTNWGVQIDSELSDDNPTSAFVFVHNKQTLLFSEGQGIQVIT